MNQRVKELKRGSWVDEQFHAATRARARRSHQLVWKPSGSQTVSAAAASLPNLPCELSVHLFTGPVSLKTCAPETNIRSGEGQPHPSALDRRLHDHLRQVSPTERRHSTRGRPGWTEARFLLLKVHSLDRCVNSLEAHRRNVQALNQERSGCETTMLTSVGRCLKLEDASMYHLRSLNCM